MNRTENLLKALPTWLAQEPVDEVLIVDWSSRIPVMDSLREAGIRDRRVRVVRTVDEPRWILSYAFNLGFRLARHDLILKVDADITLNTNFFDRNQLRERSFIAGNLEMAEIGQEHINGFFFVHRIDLLRIKGFNEYLTTYGWDDDDIYARLECSGIKRVCVDTTTIFHIPHDDSQRLGVIAHEKDNALAQLDADTLHSICSNRYLVRLTPSWNRDCLLAPFEIIRDYAGYTEVRRNADNMPHLVSADIRQDAKYYAALELLARRVGSTVYHLSRDSFLQLLKRKRLEEISQFDIDVLIDDGEAKASQDRQGRHSLYIELPSRVSQNALSSLAHLINRELKSTDTTIFVRDEMTVLAGEFLSQLEVPAVVLNRRVRHTGLRRLRESDLFALRRRVCSDSGAHLMLSNDFLPTLCQIESDSEIHRSAPAVAPRRHRLFIDVQHGLGNRLRAFGSAAAIARATDHELVVLWTPDHHCECRFNDLFAYNGAVIEDQAEVPAEIRRYNYMEIEPGAIKGELIDTEGPFDVLVRSAFALSHPASRWESENEELRDLRPSERVRELVNRVHLGDGCVGVHIRMEAGAGMDQNTYDSALNWTAESHEQMHHWRARSHYSAFIRRLDQLLLTEPEQRFFLAADLPRTYEVFRKAYGDRMHYLPRHRFDRSAEQIVSALADAILLSRCTRLLGSTWSSFSELAMRLSTAFKKIEMSGIDF